MSIRIAAGDHERKAPDKFEISLLADDLPNQKRTLLIGDLVIFETGWKAGHLGEVFLMNSPGTIAVIPLDDQNVRFWDGIGLQWRCKSGAWLNVKIGDIETRASCPLKRCKLVFHEMGKTC